MSRTSDCFDENRRFDEYGNYGENNGPLPPRVENDRKDIRPMTEEERQRAKEREAANTVAYIDKEPFALGLEVVKEHEDGSADYTVHMGDAARDKLTEIGLTFVLYCAASGMDIQDALDMILEQGDSDEQTTDSHDY